MDDEAVACMSETTTMGAKMSDEILRRLAEESLLGSVDPKLLRIAAAAGVSVTDFIRARLYVGACATLWPGEYDRAGIEEPAHVSEHLLELHPLNRH